MPVKNLQRIEGGMKLTLKTLVRLARGLGELLGRAGGARPETWPSARYRDHGRHTKSADADAKQRQR